MSDSDNNDKGTKTFNMIGNIFKSLGFPFKVMEKDGGVLIWIFVTFMAIAFPFIADFLLGKQINRGQNGELLLISIGLLIPILGDEAVFLLSEERKEQLLQNQGLTYEQTMYPLIKRKSINGYLGNILIASLFALLFSILCYSGSNRANLVYQFPLLIISLYISLYYFCLNRIIQYPDIFNETYQEIEKSEMNEINSSKKNIFVEDNEEIDVSEGDESNDKYVETF